MKKQEGVVELGEMANQVARHLRKSQTIAEGRLWGELRELRRQGVDGFQHLEPEGAAKDTARDADLTWRGFKVLRFTNSDVSDNLDGVVIEILAALGAVAKVE